MKYALLSIFAVIIAASLSTLIVLLINKKHTIKNWLKAIFIPTSSILLIICFVLTYFAFNYKATDNAKSYLKSDEVVRLNITQHYYHFDYEESNDTAIVFYCGAKVDPVAYSPLCSDIAHMGVDVYIIKMPLYFPLFNINAANNLVKSGIYNNYYLMGHSLGGTTAGLYLANANNSSLKGIIFLASYPNKKLNDSYKCLSIYGTNDLVLNKDEYNKNISNFPNNYEEIVIEGGNHSNFGDYGHQRGDGEASISNNEQISITKNAVINFVNNN